MAWFKFLAIVALVTIVRADVGVQTKTNESALDIEDSSTRVVNGIPARSGEFPWQALVRVRIAKSTIFCSGALISPICVLTQARCLINNQGVSVYLGSTVFSTGTEIVGRRFVVHPNFNLDNRVFNLAVLQLVQRAPRSFTVQPISLPPAHLETFGFDNQIVRMAGYGSTSITNPFDHLQWGNFRILPATQCANIFPQLRRGFVLCLANTGGHSSHPGFGDNGAPISWRYNNRDVLVGLFAFGRPADLFNGGPGGFINVARHTRWILHVLSFAHL